MSEIHQYQLPETEEAREYLDQKSLDNLDEATQGLVKVALGFTHSSMAVELRREARRRAPITPGDGTSCA